MLQGVSASHWATPRRDMIPDLTNTSRTYGLFTVLRRGKYSHMGGCGAKREQQLRIAFVRTLLRWLFVAVVAAACVAQPVAVDACRAACDTARSAWLAATPPCHHAAAGSQVGQPSRSCGQDHAVVPADPGVGAPAHSLASASHGPSTSLFGAVALRVARVDSSTGPPPISISLASHTPLRI